MSQDNHPTTTLLEPGTDKAKPAHEVQPRRTFPFVWLLAAAVTVALAGLAVWTLAQVRTVDELVDAPLIHSVHDGYIEMQLREQGRATPTQVDPWTQRMIRDRETRAGQQLDGWAHRHLRDRQAAEQPQLDPWIRNRLREQTG